MALQTAAFAQGMRSKAPTRTQLIREDGKHKPRRPDIVLRTSRTLDESDIHLVNGLRCTTAERTMRDLAEVLPHVAPLRAIGIDAFRDEVLDLALLHAEVEAMRPGAARDRLAEVAADLARVRTESPFAYEVLEAMVELDLPVEAAALTLPSDSRQDPKRSLPRPVAAELCVRWQTGSEAHPVATDGRCALCSIADRIRSGASVHGGPARGESGPSGPDWRMPSSDRVMGT
jgi:hypothetical protein